MNWLSIFIGLLLVSVSALCFFMTNFIYSRHYSPYYLLLIMFVFSFEILVFYWGLHTNSVIMISLIWSIFYIIGIIISGVILYQMHYSVVNIIAFLLACTSIILLAIDNTHCMFTDNNNKDIEIQP